MPNDSLPKPSVLTVVKSGSFTLRILAYRVLSASESQAVAARWLKANRLRAFPSSGTATVSTMIGFVP